MAGSRRPAALFKRKADNLAAGGADLIMMEMMRDGDYAVWATEAAIATGLPVWVGISVEKRDAWRTRGLGAAKIGCSTDIVPRCWPQPGPHVISIMHTSPNDTGEAMDIVRKHWKGPLGAYPESGYFTMPDWQFVDIIAPDELVSKIQDVEGSRARRSSAVAAASGLNISRHSARSMQMMKTGSCLCGAVKYEIHGPLRPVIACHCIQCRKQTGYLHVMPRRRRMPISSSHRRPRPQMVSLEPAKARRGFCGECGSVLFWKGDGSDNISITAGSIDGPTGARARRAYLLRERR